MEINAKGKANLLMGLLIAALVSVGGCQTPPPSYDAFTPKPSKLFEYPLFEFSTLADQPNGMAISAQGRIFIAFPRWVKNPRYSVAEMMEDGSLRPYPDASWNRGGNEGAPGTRFVCAQSLSVDDDDNLWILDAASPFLRGTEGAKLVKVNLENDNVEQVIHLGRQVAPKDCYLNNMCIDSDSGVVYTADSGLGAIVVTDTSDGTSRRLLAGDPSTRAEAGYVPVVGGRPLAVADGAPPLRNVASLALDSRGEYLYYHAFFARELYRIKADLLTDPIHTPEEVARKVEKVRRTGAVAAMLMDEDDNLYLTMPEHRSIMRLHPHGKPITLVQDEHLQWPGPMSISPDNYLYFTDPQINRLPQFNGGTDRQVPPYEVFKIFLPTE